VGHDRVLGSLADVIKRLNLKKAAAVRLKASWSGQGNRRAARLDRCRRRESGMAQSTFAIWADTVIALDSKREEPATS